MNKYPRAVYFSNGLGVCAGVSGQLTSHDSMVVVLLPSEHYDFVGPVNVRGKTLSQIEKEVESY